MDQIVNNMEHLEIDTACQWLTHLIESPFPVSRKILMGLCEQYSTPVYIDCSALEGVIAPLVGSSFVAQQVIGTELCQVESPASAFEAFDPHQSGGIDVTGMAVVLSDQEQSEGSYVHSWILTNQEGRPFLFRPADIKRLATFLKPDQNKQVNQGQAQLEETIMPRGSINDDRLKLIRLWFGQQQEYNAASLSKPTKGLRGARDACWQWLSQSGHTAQGALFSGATPNRTGKSKKFITAWSAFRKEMPPDEAGRPKN